jgi:hypothetical protein
MSLLSSIFLLLFTFWLQYFYHNVMHILPYQKLVSTKVPSFCHRLTSVCLPITIFLRYCYVYYLKSTFFFSLHLIVSFYLPIIIFLKSTFFLPSSCFFLSSGYNIFKIMLHNSIYYLLKSTIFWTSKGLFSPSCWHFQNYMEICGRT